MPRPIAMQQETKAYLFDRIKHYSKTPTQSAREIGAALDISVGTITSWVNGTQVPSTKHMPAVLKLFNLYSAECERCKIFTIGDKDELMLCPTCQRLHVIKDGKVVRK